MKYWGKLDKKLSRFWGLPRGKGTRYPYNEDWIATDKDIARIDEEIKKVKEEEKERLFKKRWPDEE